MGYTHFNKVSGIEEVAVGAAGSEKKIADSDGKLYDAEKRVGVAHSEIVTEDKTLTAADSGKTIFISGAGGVAITLPAPAMGLRFRFVNLVVATSTDNHTILSADGDNIIQGQIPTVEDVAGTSMSNQDTITLAHTNGKVGDWLICDSDGTNWFFGGGTQLAAGVTSSAT